MSHSQEDLIPESVSFAILEYLKTSPSKFFRRPQRPVPFEFVAVRRSLFHPHGGRTDEESALPEWNPPRTILFFFSGANRRKSAGIHGFEFPSVATERKEP